MNPALPPDHQGYALLLVTDRRTGSRPRESLVYGAPVLEDGADVSAADRRPVLISAHLIPPM